MDKIGSLVMIPAQELEKLMETQSEILQEIRALRNNRTVNTLSPGYITAIEFMEAVKISRSKFDQLVNAGNIEILKKRRKIYVAVGEVKRYFADPSIL